MLVVGLGVVGVDVIVGNGLIVSGDKVVVGVDWYYVEK